MAGGPAYARPTTTTGGMMTTDFSFSIRTTRFDEDYVPSSGSRITTNFANLARGEHRRENLRRALRMIDERENELEGGGDRSAVVIDIVSADMLLGIDEETAERGERHTT